MEAQSRPALAGGHHEHIVAFFPTERVGHTVAVHCHIGIFPDIEVAVGVVHVVVLEHVALREEVTGNTLAGADEHHVLAVAEVEVWIALNI